MEKKKVEEEQQRGRRSILSSVKIPGLMSCYYFIIMVKKTEDPLQCGGLVVLHPRFPPLHYSSVSRAMRWALPVHAHRCSDAAQRMRCVTTEQSKLAGSRDQGQDLGLFITTTLQTASPKCMLWETEASRVSLFLYNFFFLLHWSIIVLQCCISFCSAMEWISYMCVYIYPLSCWTSLLSPGPVIPPI